MVKCPMCKQEFADKQQFDAHDCESIAETRDIPSQRDDTFEEKAANYGWRLAIIAFVISFLLRQAGMQMPWAVRVAAYAITATYTAGFLLSLAGMCGALFRRIRNIIGPALLGLFLNGLALSIIVYTICTTTDISAAPQAGAPAPTPAAPATPRAEFSKEAEDEAGKLIVGGNRATIPGCSIAIPSNWKKMSLSNGNEMWAEKLPGANFTMAHLPIDGDLEQSLRDIETGLKDHLKGYRKVSQTAISTAAGARILRMVITCDKLVDLHQTYYLLDGSKGMLFMVTCTGNDDQDAMFDGCVMTFKLEP